MSLAQWPRRRRPGPKPFREIEEAANAHGHTLRTLRRAKADLGVIAFKTGLQGGWSCKPSRRECRSCSARSPDACGNAQEHQRHAGIAGDDLLEHREEIGGALLHCLHIPLPPNAKRWASMTKNGHERRLGCQGQAPDVPTA